MSGDRAESCTRTTRPGKIPKIKMWQEVPAGRGNPSKDDRGRRDAARISEAGTLREIFPALFWSPAFASRSSVCGFSPCPFSLCRPSRTSSLSLRRQLTAIACLLNRHWNSAWAERSALLRKLLGAGVGHPAIGLLVPRHERPPLSLDKTAHLPGILVLHLGELLGLRHVPVHLRQANRTQALGDGGRSALLRPRLGRTVRHPSAKVESDKGGNYRAADATPQTDFNLLRVH